MFLAEDLLPNLLQLARYIDIKFCVRIIILYICICSSFVCVVRTEMSLVFYH